MALPYSGLEIFVTVNGRTYTALELGIQEIQVTDVDEGDNEVEITIPDPDYHIIDNGPFKVGSIMGISWGYTDQKTSQQRSGYVILKPSVMYNAEGVVCKVKASTKSATLAARRPQKTYGNTALKTIIADVCKRNGITLNIKGGDEKVTNFSHGAWSDREVVQVLADRFGYQATWVNQSLEFSKRDYGATPTIQLIFNMGDESNIIEAQLEVDAKKGLGEDAKTTATAVDTNLKRFLSADSLDSPQILAISAEDGHTWVTKLFSPKSPTYAQQMYQANLDKGSSTGIVPQNIAANLPPELAKLISTPEIDQTNLEGLATADTHKKAKKKGELSITSEGIVLATARQIVNVKGLAKRDSGNWYAISVEHHISQDAAYETKWELGRHGNNTKGTEKNKGTLNNNSNVTNSGGNKKAVAVDAETGKVTR